MAGGGPGRGRNQERILEASVPVLPAQPPAWLGEEGLVSGLGGGDINHAEHLSGGHLELKGNTRQKGRTSHPRLPGL